jgi:TRAP-type C4-dicarboxylate transport system permease small subunit
LERVAASLLKWLMRAELVVACGCLAFAAGSICADVIARQLFHQGFFGVQTVAVYCSAIAGALGLSIVVHGGGHLRITAVDSLIPRQHLHWVSRLGDVVSAAVFAFLGWYAALFVASTYGFGETDVVLHIPIWPIQLVLPVAFGLACLKFLVHAAFPATRPAEAALQ